MLEIIAMSVEDAVNAEKGGADRIELVSALSEGGLTPSYALIKHVVSAVQIPVNVMIRPHAKSFCYSKEDIKVMKEDILIAKELHANGVVFGVLNSENEICRETLDELLQCSKGMDVTFHRAIDELYDPVQGVQLLKKYDEITSILTSGGKGSIRQNTHILRKMIMESCHIRILLGSGLSLENIEGIMGDTGAEDYHFGTAARENAYVYSEVDESRVRALAQVIHKRKEV